MTTPSAPNAFSVIFEAGQPYALPPPWSFLRTQQDYRCPPNDRAALLAQLTAQFPEDDLVQLGIIKRNNDGSIRLCRPLAETQSPILAIRQSWLGALTTILDTCALAIVGVGEGAGARQAELTFAMARHAIVDLSIVLRTAPRAPDPDRLPGPRLAELRAFLAAAGVTLREGKEVEQRLVELRLMYEPYVYALARFLCIAVPAWIPEDGWIDNWQTSAWELVTALRRGPPSGKPGERHF